MANYAGGDTERFEREWQDGCAKLGELVAKGYFGKTDASKLIEDSCIVINKTDLPNEKKEVLKKMTMFDTVGVGVDLAEVKRQAAAQAAAQAERKTKLSAAKKALAKGLSPVDAADLADLPIDEVQALVKN
jgi:hypothetical protein